MNNHHSRSIAALVLLLVFTLPIMAGAQSDVGGGGAESGSPVDVGGGKAPNTPVDVGGGRSPDTPIDVGGGRAESGSRGTFYLQNPLKFNTVGGIIGGFLDIFSYLVVILAVLMLIWTGLQFVLAQGNSERIKELKNHLLWIVVGVAIVIGARIIVGVVINTLSATGVNQGVINNANNALRNSSNP